MAPFYGWGSTVSRLQSHDTETVCLPLLFETKAEISACNVASDHPSHNVYMQ